MKQTTYEPNGIYHIYNHANGWENVFACVENYHYFLRKYWDKVSPVADTLAYCLMPNHFHLLIRVREAKVLDVELDAYFKRKPKVREAMTVEEQHHFIVRRYFHNFLSGYVKGFNKYHRRKGSLLRQNTRRKLVHDVSYLMNVITYIHLNPVVHDFVLKPEEWTHSSYLAYLNDMPTKIIRDEVLSWYSNREDFIKVHHDRLVG